MVVIPETDSTVYIVTELVPLEPPMFIVLLVNVSVVALPTSVSGPAGNVNVSPLKMVAITGAVNVLLVRVSVDDAVIPDDAVHT